MRAWCFIALIASALGCATPPTCLMVGGWEGSPRRQMCWNTEQEAMAALTQMKREAEEDNARRRKEAAKERARKNAEWLAKQTPKVQKEWAELQAEQEKYSMELEAEQSSNNTTEEEVEDDSARKVAEQKAALRAMMDSANRLAHSSDAAMDSISDSSQHFNQTMRRMESERLKIDPSPRFEQGTPFGRSTLPYGIQGGEVPIEELDRYVPSK